MTKMQFHPIDKFPFGYKITEAETDRVIVEQHAAAYSSDQKDRWDNINGIGFNKLWMGAVEAVEQQNKEGRQMAASGHLLSACQAALRIVELWRYPDNVKPEHEGEAQAIASMESMLRSAVELATCVPESDQPEFRKTENATWQRCKDA